MLSWPRGWLFPVGVGYVFVALVLDRLSDIGLYRGLGVTPWNPTSGFSLAFSWVFGISSFPFILVAEVLSQTFLSRAEFKPGWIALLSLASALVWASSAKLLRGLADFDPRLGNIPAVLSLIMVSLLIAVAQCVIYVGVLWAHGLATAATLFPVSWRLIVGHLVGVLVVSPLVLMLHAGWRLPRLTVTRVGQILLLLACVWVIFNYQAATAYQLFYILFLPVLWVALRDGIGGATLLLNVAQVGIIIGAQFRYDLVPGTGALQILMIALALTGLLVGAVVTDRQAAGNRLREQHAALGRALRLRSAGETAAAISHQINQPLTAISTYASVAREAVNDGKLELARSALDKLSAECDRAADVARSIRDLVKQGSLSPTPVRVEEVLAGIRTAHQAECAGLDIAVEIEVKGILPPIMLDKVQLDQAVDNLVTNSIEAISEGGRGNRIKISAGVENGDLHIDVSDNGPGFAPGLEAIATTPFMTTKRNGTGLGLAIARSVAEAHGGSLAVVNRSSGASVRIRLPTTGKQDGQVDQHH